MLCSTDDMPNLTMPLQSRSSSITLRHAPDLATLLVCLHAAEKDFRLISYMSSVIVPAEALARCDLGAYNIHPGSTAYPGSAPDAWACYEQAPTFGATAHVMSIKVDEGPIIDQELLQVPPAAHRRIYANLGSCAALRLFVKLAERLASPEPLQPAANLAWSGTKRKSADFKKMCVLAPDITREEFERRILSFGPPDVAEFSLMLHGHKFIMVNESGVRGYLDNPVGGRILGWAWDSATPSRHLNLVIRVDDSREYTVKADGFRQDVRDAGYGDGFSGFCWTPPSELCNGLPHRIEVMAAGRLLPGSPKLVIFPRPVQDDSCGFLMGRGVRGPYTTL